MSLLFCARRISFSGNMAAQQRFLVLTDDAILPIKLALHVLGELQNGRVEPDNIQIITQASSLSKLPFESSSVDAIVTISLSLEFPSTVLLEEISRILKPEGKILLKLGVETANAGKDMTLSSLKMKLLVAGFLEPESVVTKSKESSSFGVKAKKPSWKIGSSFSIKKVTKSLPKIELDDSDLIDEDSLLTEEDLKKPQLPVVGDCEVGSTRQACKNCTCGRAEAEEKVLKLGLTTDQLNNPQSACGSCGLGDAFRCSTCPYKGLPPFKLGEKVSLSENFLVADI
ncbi:Anamorsin-like protein [Drosera capensis]